MSKWREIRNAIIKSNAIRIEQVTYPSGVRDLFVFRCLVCAKEIRMQDKHIPYSTGKCKKHAQQLKPFEAVFGGLVRNARWREVEFDLTYDQYLEFTNQPCFYCGGNIPWNPWNEHGKNSPGYYLDRLNSNQGYSIQNCVACCSRCNMAKRAMASVDFISMCHEVARNRSMG